MEKVYVILLATVLVVSILGTIAYGIIYWTNSFTDSRNSHEHVIVDMVNHDIYIFECTKANCKEPLHIDIFEEE